MSRDFSICPNDHGAPVEDQFIVGTHLVDINQGNAQRVGFFLYDSAPDIALAIRKRTR